MSKRSLYVDIELDESSRQEFLEYISDSLSKLESGILEMHGKTKSGIAQFLMDLHSLKGVGGSYGFVYISEVCHTIEENIQNHSDEKYSMAFSDSLLKNIESIENYLNLFINNKDPKDLQKALDTFQSKLETESKSTLPRILICDSKKVIQKLLKGSEVGNSFDITYVDLGMTALSRVISQNWDYLFISNELQDISGLSVVYALKSSGQEIPEIIFLSSDKQKKFIDQLKPDYFLHVDGSLLDKLTVILSSSNVKKPA